jgi:hypothetical protein
MIFKAYCKENPDCEGEKISSEVIGYDNLTEFLICGDEPLMDYMIKQLEDGKSINKKFLFDYYNCDDEILTVCGEAKNLKEFCENNFIVLEND